MQKVTPLMCARAANDTGKDGALPAPYSLRAADARDLDGILKAGVSSFAYNPPTRREIRHALTKMHGAVAVLCAEGAIAGYVLVEAHMGRKSLYLNTVAVEEAHRGKGLSGVLYTFVDTIAKLCGAVSVGCHVAHGNDRAVHLLERHGYHKTGTLEEYYDDGNAAICMRKKMI